MIMPTPDVPGSSASTGLGWFSKEIQGMMHSFGDAAEPSRETAELVESIVRDQLKEIVGLLSEAAVTMGSKKIDVKEFLILLRKTPVKLRRFCKFLQAIDFKKLADHSMTPEDEYNFACPDLLNSKKVREALNFLNYLDPSGYLASVADPSVNPVLFGGSIADESVTERTKRIERMTITMDVEQYLNYSKVKSNTLRANKQLPSKLQEWLLSDSTVEVMPMTVRAWRFLGFFAYETVAQIVDLAFIVRRDNEAIRITDTVAKLAPINSDVNKQLTWSSMMKPLQVSEVMEAMRRYNTQRSMCTPFNRNCVPRPGYRLLAL